MSKKTDETKEDDKKQPEGTSEKTTDGTVVDNGKPEEEKPDASRKDKETPAAPESSEALNDADEAAAPAKAESDQDERPDSEAKQEGVHNPTNVEGGVARQSEGEAVETPNDPKVDEHANDDKNPDAPQETEEEKGATIGDLVKRFDSLAKSLDAKANAELVKAVGALTDKVEKSLTDLAGRVDALEKAPAGTKTAASFTEVTKGAETSDQDDELKALVKRRDELAADPTLGTPQERAEVYAGLTKLSQQGVKIPS